MSEKKNNNGVLHVVDVNLETGIEWACNSVYMICNENSKTCIIGYSTNLYLSLGRILGDIRKGSGEYKALAKDIANCKTVILETNIEAGDLKLRHSYYCSLYLERGYKFYKDYNIIRYKLETIMEYRYGMIYYCTYLTNTRGDKKLVGVFKKRKDMNEWIRVNYPDTSRIGRVVVQPGVERAISSNKKAQKA